MPPFARLRSAPLPGSRRRATARSRGPAGARSRGYFGYSPTDASNSPLARLRTVSRGRRVDRLRFSFDPPRPESISVDSPCSRRPGPRLPTMDARRKTQADLPFSSSGLRWVSVPVAVVPPFARRLVATDELIRQILRLGRRHDAEMAGAEDRVVRPLPGE